jgi:ABC-type transporter MlaC component
MRSPMIKSLTRLATAGITAVALAGTASAADKEQQALAKTQTLLTEAHTALTSNSNAELRRAIDDAFAFEVWERFLIENRADAFTPEQRERFRELLPGYLAYLYHNQFDKGLDTPPTLGEAKPARSDVLVSAKFKRANGQDLPVDWRLRDFPNEGPQVIDVMVGGTSFLLLKRDEFASIIDKRGADGLLEYMQQHSL